MIPRNAVVIINKESGVTSFRCLNTIKHTVNKKTGHCGTLDRFASGLMIALCGKYTKLNERFMGLDKTYIAKIEFGKETDTLDPEGEIISTAQIPSFESIEKAVANLTGDIMQVPPMYSALHVNGKRSYELARKGHEVELEARPVHIFNATIISWDSPYLLVSLHVSKGTYVRSWARDLGHLTGSCAYVTELCRTQVGPFKLSEAVNFNDEKALSEIDEQKSAELIERLNNYERII